MTFTLVESRLADESQYQAAGHLDEPYRILTRDALSDQRRELLNNWFGPLADRWIKSKEMDDAAK